MTRPAAQTGTEGEIAALAARPAPRPTASPARPEAGSPGAATGAGSPATDDSGDGPTTGPNRRCIVTREVRPKAALIRFVVGPDGSVVPDIGEKLPGRGLWVGADRATLERAVAKNAFARAARAKVSVPADLAERTAALLERRVVDLLSLARGAGEAVAGFVKVEDRLRHGGAALVFAARDGAADGRAKIARLADRAGARIVDGLDAATLGRAFGRDAVVHAAVSAGGLADRLTVEAARLDGISGAGTDGPAAKG